MPLFQLANIPEGGVVSGANATASTGGSWALWQIEESEEELLSRLNPARFPQEELQQIKLAQRRLEWLACRMALQALLPDLQEGTVRKNENGRPYLHGSEWHISLSHAYPYAAAAVHPTRPVGLDIEQPRPQLLRIKQKFLSRQEQEWVGDDLRQLCMCWAAKEALYKLHGQPGLIFAQDMQLNSVRPEADQLQALLKGSLYHLYFQWHHNLLLCVAS